LRARDSEGDVRSFRSMRTNQKQKLAKKGVRICPDVFVFYEKRTGAPHFRVEADSGGRLPADQAAGLLAMHCLVRGQTPRDYVVMVEASDPLLNGVSEKAERLLQAGRSLPTPVKLSRREEEVLGGLMRSLANKEIAAALHLSERTVKFHVSSLLAKFRVRGRMELVREATRSFLPSRVPSQPEMMPFPTASRELQTYAPPQDALRRRVRSADVLPLAPRQLSARISA
jgi:DNA-binding CsgD family transcriptional regulator